MHARERVAVVQKGGRGIEVTPEVHGETQRAGGGAHVDLMACPDGSGAQSSRASRHRSTSSGWPACSNNRAA